MASQGSSWMNGIKSFNVRRVFAIRESSISHSERTNESGETLDAPDGIDLSSPHLTYRLKVRLCVTRSLCHQRVGKLDLALEDCQLALRTLGANAEENAQLSGVGATEDVRHLANTHQTLLQLVQIRLGDCREARSHVSEVEDLTKQILQYRELLVKDGSNSMRGDRVAELKLERARAFRDLLGNYDGAAEDLQKALRLNPRLNIANLIDVLRFGDVLRDVIESLCEWHRYDTVRAIADDTRLSDVRAYAIDCLDDLMNRHRMEGIHLFCGRQVLKAVEELSLALNVMKYLQDPRPPLLNGENLQNADAKAVAVLFSSRASCLFELGDFDAALSDCGEAISLNPNHIQAWLTKCACLDALGDNERYMQTVREAVQAFGHSSAPIANLAARALAMRPGESADAEVVTTDDVFLA